MKILVADSDQLQLKTYQDNVIKLFAPLKNNKKDEAIEVQYCNTGFEVASLMENSKTRYDLSIMDRSLSGIPGDIIASLYKDRLGKIIICSIFNKIDDFFYLQKPLDFDKLSELIKEVFHVTDTAADTGLQELQVIG